MTVAAVAAYVSRFLVWKTAKKKKKKGDGNKKQQDGDNGDDDDDDDDNNDRDECQPFTYTRKS